MLPRLKLTKLETATLFAATIFLLRITFPPSSFADFRQYVEIAKDLSTTSLSELLAFEGASRSAIRYFGALFADTASGISVLSYLNSIAIAFVLALLWIKSNSSTTSFVVAMSLFGPLLIFVTLRASTAYVIATFVALFCFSNVSVSLLLLLIAAQFHATAYIIIPIYLAALLLTKISNQNENFVKKARFFGFLCIATAICAMLFREISLGALVTLTDSIDPTGDFGKFITYASLPEEPISAAHSVYFVLASIIAVVTLKANDTPERRFIWYFIGVSFLAYCILNISPVVGYRFSIYFALPAILAVHSRINFVQGSFRTMLTTGFIALGIVDFFAVLEK